MQPCIIETEKWFDPFKYFPITFTFSYHLTLNEYPFSFLKVITWLPRPVCKIIMTFFFFLMLLWKNRRLSFFDGMVKHSIYVKVHHLCVKVYFGKCAFSHFSYLLSLQSNAFSSFSNSTIPDIVKVQCWPLSFSFIPFFALSLSLSQALNSKLRLLFSLFYHLFFKGKGQWKEALTFRLHLFLTCGPIFCMRALTRTRGPLRACEIEGGVWKYNKEGSESVRGSWCKGESRPNREIKIE